MRYSLLHATKSVLFTFIVGFALNSSAQTTFNYTGSVQYYTVPTGTTCINVDVQGAAGGINSHGIAGPPYCIDSGGHGARVQATLVVAPGAVLAIYVGGRGPQGILGTDVPGGFNGGGGGMHAPLAGITPNICGGGGGGASDIRTGAGALTDRVVVAGGGGGGGGNWCSFSWPGIYNYDKGGDGGTTTGEAGWAGNIVGGTGAGGGGTPGGGGFGGTSLGGGLGAGTPGTLGQGGTAGTQSAGGGGGGGYYGGGGSCYSGGGGGSSFADPAVTSGVSHTRGYQAGNGVITISPVPPPTAGTIVGPTHFCIGATATYTNPTAPPVITWSSSNPAVATIGSSSGIANGISPGVTTITCTITTACGFNSSTLTVTVDPLPAVGPISGPSNVCVGNTILLFDALPGGIWSSMYGLTTVSPGTGLVTGAAPGVDSIKYTMTNFCGSAYAAYPVTVNALSDPGTITGPSSVCVGWTMTLADAVPGGGWSASNGRATVVAGLVTGVSTGLDTIYYATANSCGIQYASKVITVMTLPDPGTVTGATSVCVGASITMADAVAGGIWTASNNKATVTLSGDVTGAFKGLDTIMYAVTNMCGTSTATKVVNIIDVPVVNPITGSAQVCLGGTTTLADATAGGVWAAASSLVSVSSGGVVSGITVGNTTISYTVTNTCGSTTVTKDIEVLINPSSVTITGDTVVCPDQYDPFTASIPGGTWSITNTHGYIDETGVAAGVYEGWDTVLYTITNQCGTGSARFPVYVLSDSICHPVYVHPVSAIESSMDVYPNPNNGAFTMKVTSGMNEDVEVSVSNVVGERVYLGKTVANKLTEVRLVMPPGIYLLNAVTAHGKYVAKLTIE